MSWDTTTPRTVRRAGERPAWNTYTDQFSPAMVADPQQAYEDALEAHRWATREKNSAEPGSIREYNLQQERVRLAWIASRLKQIINARRRS